MTKKQRTRNPHEHKTDRYIGQKIKEYRLARGYTQTELAEMIGITFQQVQKYERGSNRVSVSRLVSIAGLLNVPIDFFFEEKVDEESHKEAWLSALDQIKDQQTLHYLTGLLLKLGSVKYSKKGQKASMII